MEARFTKIYDKAIWGKNYKGEGGSGKGDGTSPDSTHYVKLIINFIQDNNIKTVCDIGAGDWKFSRFIPWAQMGITYTGVDVVKSVVDSNNEEHSSDYVSFVHGDILTFDCSGYDLVLIKDVLQHFKDLVELHQKIIGYQVRDQSIINTLITPCVVRENPS